MQFETARSFFLSSMSAAQLPSRPVQIVAFNSGDPFDQIRTTQGAAAFYAGGSNGDYIAMKHSSLELRPVAIHEYVHLLLRYSGLRAPLWWQEGIAEFYSTLRVLGGEAEIGAANELRTNVPPAQTVARSHFPFETGKDSPLYQDSEKADSYYAQCWLLVHMLFFFESYRAQIR